jgi:hypothetical protein
VTTARVELALRPGVDTGLGPGPLVVDAPHDEAGAFYQLALELAGLPVPARRRILGERMTAAARRIDIVGHSMPAAPPPAGGAIAQNGDHDLVGCLARLLAANLLTVDEFESKRRLLGARADGEQSGP